MSSWRSRYFAWWGNRLTKQVDVISKSPSFREWTRTPKLPLCGVYARERYVPRSGDLSGGRRLRW